MQLNSSAPTGPIETRWTRHRFAMKLVNPANRRKHHVIVVGFDGSGGSARALRWAVAEGEKVAAGDVILELDARRQDTRIAEAKSQLAANEARLAELEEKEQALDATEEALSEQERAARLKKAAETTKAARR